MSAPSEPPVPLDPAIFGDANPCYGCSAGHPHGFRLQPERHGREVRVRYTPNEHQQGPLGVMHGGLVTTLADELAAWAVIGLVGRFGFTGRIEARLARPVRLGAELQGRAWLQGEASRLAKVEVELHQEGELAFSGVFTFVLPDRAGAERIMGMPLPEQWLRFVR